ncbi:hypothetical protein BGW38_004629 [Lunasporangiospora selenospora]|uniref:SAM-dependent MTase RsmB/NOP-type domain-containing protein n=1 Tax=Lunasporangiospora selenospora TaxID=979761 RepID=A0A9P6KBX0_9FUNG|nr:hypothetical protein BGW38_004629 [Lunasporangiospora selenospora]
MDSEDDDYPFDELTSSGQHPKSSTSKSESNVDLATTPRATFSLDNLPSDFVAFLAKNDIDPAIYTVTDLPRYVRLNPDPHLTISPEELGVQLGTKVEPVSGLEDFCRLSGHVKLRNTQAYKDGRIFGMDLSSGIAVYALDIQPGEHVLDICCAPGAKLCMIAGILNHPRHVRSDPSQKKSKRLHMDIAGTVTGVDISAHRLATCRSLLKRHQLQQQSRLFQADGTTFGVMRPTAIESIQAKIKASQQASEIGEKDEKMAEYHHKEPKKQYEPKEETGSSTLGNTSHDGEPQKVARAKGTTDREDPCKRRKLDTVELLQGLLTLAPVSGLQDQCKEEDKENLTPYRPLDQEKTTPFFASKILRNDPQLKDERFKYDKVIVDAECTHDGSIAHILKYETWGWDNFHKNFMSRDRLDSLRDLQRNLLLNGFRLTKPDGIIVYSTCSLSKAQNEDVIAWFVAKMRGRAVLETLPRNALGITRAVCKRPSREVVVEALGLQEASTIGASHNNSTPQERWQGTPEQEVDMERFQAHVTEMCLRFDPLASNTSGFFLARIRKIY